MAIILHDVQFSIERKSTCTLFDPILPYPIFRMIDIFLVESPATSVALSPSGDFLATTHVDDLGIYLWSNKTMYSHVSLRSLSEKTKPTFTDLPTTKLTEHDETDVESNTQRNENELTMDDVSEKTPLAEGLVTLSMLPKSRWSNLQNLDIIKERNKPMEPAKTPKLAPFFLPTLPGLQPKFLPSEEGSDIPVTEVGGGSKILNLGELNPLSEFQKCLQQCASNNQCECTVIIIRLCAEGQKLVGPNEAGPRGMLPL